MVHLDHSVQPGRNLCNLSEVLQIIFLSSICHTFLSTYFLLIFDQNMYHTGYRCVPIHTSTPFLIVMDHFGIAHLHHFGLIVLIFYLTPLFFRGVTLYIRNGGHFGGGESFKSFKNKNLCQFIFV